MDTALRGPIGKICSVYLDDIVMFFKVLQEYHENIFTLLERLRATGLKLQPHKCKLFRPELEYLGHLATRDGVKLNPNNVLADNNFNRGKLTVKKELSFLGLSGYYHKFILRNYPTITNPAKISYTGTLENPEHVSVHEPAHELLQLILTIRVQEFGEANFT